MFRFIQWILSIWIKHLGGESFMYKICCSINLPIVTKKPSYTVCFGSFYIWQHMGERFKTTFFSNFTPMISGWRTIIAYLRLVRSAHWNHDSHFFSMKKKSRLFQAYDNKSLTKGSLLHSPVLPLGKRRNLSLTKVRVPAASKMYAHCIWNSCTIFWKSIKFSK